MIERAFTMQLTSLRVTAANHKPVRDAYHTAFPKEEQLPWPILRLISHFPGGGLTAYYDGDYCGMTFTAATDSILYVMFLAVEKEHRGQGYGSAILEKLKQDYPGRAIYLNVEPLDDNAPNADERTKRMAFYAKNGFHDSGYEIDEVGGTFCVLTTDPDFRANDYQKVFQKLTFGLWKPPIRKVQ